MQIVYLSNRPAVLGPTLTAVARHMPWVHSVLVCAPEETHAAIYRATESFHRQLDLVDDADATRRTPAELRAMNHTVRNVVLRRGLIEGGHTDDVFLMSDDDYRPLTAIDETTFVDGDRHVPYYFYDLADWPGDRTTYDLGLIRTYALCQLLGVSTLAFASHMPQIVSAERWRAAYLRVDEVGAGDHLDEWSTYFNLAMAAAPDAFAEPRPFLTLAWPQWPHQWPFFVRPGPIRFENHHPEHEVEGGLFADLGPARTPSDTLARIARWREAELAIGELRFDKEWNDPWTHGRTHRRGAAAALRIAGKVRRYAAFDTDA